MWLKYLLVSLFILLIFIASVGFRSYGVSNKPLWLDEVEHLYDTMPDYDTSKVISEAADHAQPPFDHLILWKFRSEYPSLQLVRVPYLIYAIIFCILVWIWSLRLFSLPGLLASGGWLAFSSFHIYYAQEVRMYGLMMMLAVAYFLLLDIALRSRSLLIWISCLLLATMNLYTNIFTSMTLVFSGIYVFSYSAISWYEKRRSPSIGQAKKTALFWKIVNVKKWPDMLKWIIIISIAAAAFYPLYQTYLAGNLRNHQEWEQGGGKETFSFLKSLKIVFIDFSAKPKGRLPGIWFFGLLICAGIIPRKLKELPFSLTAIAMLLFYPLILSFMFSEQSNVLFKTRYVSQAFPFFVIALGAGIVHIAYWLSWILGKTVPFLKKEFPHKILFYSLLFAGTISAIIVELPATKSILKMEKSPWRNVAMRIKREYDEQHLITSQLDVACRWNLQRYIGERKNWQYIGLEELPKLSFEEKKRLWIIVDKRKVRMDLKKAENNFEITEIDSFYPSIYLFKSKKLLGWDELMKTVQPFADKMDTYAVITSQQYRYYGKARLAAKKHDFKTARKNYTRGLAIGFKKDIWINLEFARFLKSYKHYKEAIPQYEEFYNKAAPQHKPSVVKEMIDSYDCAGYPKKADALMKKYGTKEMIKERELSQFTHTAMKNMKSGLAQAAYTNYLDAYQVAPSNAVVCRRIAEICFYKSNPSRPLEAYNWNTRASELMVAKSGKRFVEADFNNAMIQSAIGRTNTAMKLYNQLLDYLKTEKPVQSNWIFKTYVYLGAIQERKDYLNETLDDFKKAEHYASTPNEKNTISNHLARIKGKLQ